MVRCWWRREHQAERGVPAAFLGAIFVYFAYRLGNHWEAGAIGFPLVGKIVFHCHKGCVTGRPAATWCARRMLSSWHPV